MQQILQAKENNTASVIAPAHGLYLEYVEYPNFR
jgi:hypothetical protein